MLLRSSLVSPTIALAPMEGLTDAPMRELLTKTSHYDFCVSEFLRLSSGPLPDKVFVKHVPELLQGGRTRSGCPVIVQLLGGNPELLAQSALQAIHLGALGIDLNFGCPAPTVNRHDGGATLLKYPDRIEAIIAAVRKSVPHSITVSAKLRLGWDEKTSIFENVVRAQNAGASYVAIHARTRTQGYAPPADWAILGKLKPFMKIPVFVNGDLWTVDDIALAQEASLSNCFMLGRGAVVNPYLAAMAKNTLANNMNWPSLFTEFVSISKQWGHGDAYCLRRLKQWARLAHCRGHFASWGTVRTCETLSKLMAQVV